jgi:hypothetical protein
LLNCAAMAFQSFPRIMVHLYPELRETSKRHRYPSDFRS